ncbi:MAG: hypothetical protein JWN17_3259 [Frankiales bacterium]|nr:hypothetical protein [Frankiales bacterium]
MSRRRTTALTALLGAAALAVPAATAAGTSAGGTVPCRAQTPLTFSAPTYVDITRAGGEPLVATLPNGDLLYSAHAGTTHFYAPEAPNAGTTAFAQNYTNQTYVWTSSDAGRTWTFRPRYAPPQDLPLTGFSDPEVAIDSAGDVFFSEINLANVAMSKSTDSGRSFTLQDLGAAVLTDRQWQEADRKDEVYFAANAFGGGTGVPPSPGLGHYLSKSVDGGKTFTTNVPDSKGGDGMGDLRVDKRTGTLYETHFDGSYGSGTGTLSMVAFRQARAGRLSEADASLGVIAKGVDSVSHWPAFDLDPSGNLYVTWDESGRGARKAGVYYAVSRDAGRTFSAPQRVDTDDHTDIWPWIAVGDDGGVALAWLQADVALPGNDAETPGTHGWHLYAAATDQGLGCGRSHRAPFSVARATKQAVHTGTICQGGTTCQATATDRRLGDYFSMDVDAAGRAYLGYADTRTPAAVALPGLVHQSGGPLLVGGRTTRPAGVSSATGRVLSPRR